MDVKLHVAGETQPEGGFTATRVESPGAIGEGGHEREATSPARRGPTRGRRRQS